MKRMRRIVTVAAVTLLATVGAWTSVAGAEQQAKGPRLLRAAVHADVTAVDASGERRNVTWDRGEVTAASASQVALRRKDGKTVTLGITPTTTVRVLGGGSLATGMRAIVFSRDGISLRILARAHRGASATAPTGPRAGNGAGRGLRTPMLRRAVHVAWSLVMADGRTVSIAMDKGEVTAAGPSAITLKRPDGPSVTLAVNGQTKIRVRGGGSLQPGMRAMALSRGGTALAVRAGAKPVR